MSTMRFAIFYLAVYILLLETVEAIDHDAKVCSQVEKKEFHLPPAPKLYDRYESIPLDFGVYSCIQKEVGVAGSSSRRNSRVTTSSSASRTTRRSKKSSKRSGPGYSKQLRSGSKTGGSEIEKKPPLVIFACGGTVDKSSYSMFGEEMAKRGVAVAIINKLHATPLFPGGPIVTMNAANPYDFTRIIEELRIQSPTSVDTSKTIIGGHSFGGAVTLYALAGLCHGLFCNTGPAFSGYVDVPLPPEVVAAFMYGGSIFAVGGPTGGQPDYAMSNNGTPFFSMIGGGDLAALEERDGEVDYMATFHNQIPERAVAVGENLDHDSIADHQVSNRSRKQSTLKPQRKQVEIVAKTISRWIQLQLEQHDSTNLDLDFCDELDGIDLLQEEGKDVCIHND